MLAAAFIVLLVTVLTDVKVLFVSAVQQVSVGKVEDKPTEQGRKTQGGRSRPHDPTSNAEKGARSMPRS